MQKGKTPTAAAGPSDVAISRPPAELVKAIRSGDRRAEEELVERFRRGVTLIVRRTLGAPEEADDVFQETFRIALTKIRHGDLRDPARLGGFMCSLARNQAIEHLRRRLRHRDRDGAEWNGHETEEHPGQLESLLRREKARLVRQVIGELANERDRQILFRYYISEEPKAEICRDVGLSSLHFNRVLHRARQRYRALWQQHVDGSP